jgi:putative flavoprotein involved in K+ transport
MSERFDTIVVGAGHAGLAMSDALARAGRDHVVLERGRIGETWLAQRWDGFRVNTMRRLNVLPGGPAPADPDGFPTAPELAADLETYARALPVRTGTPVRSVRPGAFGFTVEAGDRELQAARVVVASGGQNVPALPACAAAVSARVAQLHAGTYRSPETLPDGAVLVAGGAQSGMQIAEELALAGRRTYLATSRVGRYRRRYRGRDILDWLWDTGFWDQRTKDVGEAAVRGRVPQVSGADGGHTVSYQAHAALGVTLVGRVLGADGERLHLAPDAGENVRFADAESARIHGLIDEHIAREGIDAPPAEHDAADVPDPALWSLSGPTELDLSQSGIAAIVWCTGFTGSFDWLPAELLDERGVPRHREGVTDCPGLYVLGLPWLRRRASAVIFGAPGDTAHLAAELDRLANTGGRIPATGLTP